MSYTDNQREIARKYMKRALQSKSEAKFQLAVTMGAPDYDWSDADHGEGPKG